jgi:hypothetical protein
MARITNEGISNAQVLLEPASEALTHTGKGNTLIAVQHRPS